MKIRTAMGMLVLATAAWSQPALAEITAQATLGNLRVTLYDLDLTDSVTPSLTWGNPGGQSYVLSQGSAWVRASSFDEDESELYNRSLIAEPTLPLDLSYSPGAHGAIRATYTHPEPLAQELALSSRSAPLGQGEAEIAGHVSGDFMLFTLSPNTRVSLSIDMDANASTRPSATHAEYYFVTGWLSIYDLSDSFIGDGGYVLFGAGTIEGTSLTMDETVTLTGNFSNTTSNANFGRVTFGLQSEAWAKPVSAVPEPSAYALLLAGLALVGWRRHVAVPALK